VVWPLARLSLEAHLIKLLREGRARRAGETWAVSSPLA
jgi:ribonuclease/clavin/mitogillin